VSGAFDGRVALVTGAAGGMGRATARAFAAAGAAVVAADIVAEGGYLAR
jgi:NAD(P)-dependent dehydrogenase (short-subunit alcohol dehydrogenase family)